MAQSKCYACARLREASTWAGFGVALGAAVPMLDHGDLRTGIIVAIAVCGCFAALMRGGNGDAK